MRRIAALVILAALICALATSCKKDDPAVPAAGSSSYELRIQTSTSWEWWYSDKPTSKMVGSGDRTQGISRRQSPTCIVVANTRSTGSLTVSILKDGSAIDSETSSRPYGQVTVCTD